MTNNDRKIVLLADKKKTPSFLDGAKFIIRMF